MSPTGSEIAGACFISREQVSVAVSHVRAVHPGMFDDVTQVKRVVIPEDSAPYDIEVDDYPASVVARIVSTLRHMGENANCRSHELKDFAQRMKYGKVDLRVLYQKEPTAET